MSQNVAPWLAGLEEAWQIPVDAGVTGSIDISKSIDSLRRQNSNTGVNRRVGSLSMHGTRKSRSQPSTTKKRHPLATLDSNEANTLRKQDRALKLAGTASVTERNNGSVAEYGTIARRSKSTSPTKASETLEWKRRLVHGNRGYGDQTDLFGPSALENIFARSKNAVDNDALGSRQTLSWMPARHESTIPSSPPSCPLSRQETMRLQEDKCSEKSRSASAELRPPEGDDEASDKKTSSFRSNPFDLQLTDEDRCTEREDSVSSSSRIVDRSNHQGGNRNTSGQTELEGFSPVFISKQTGINGKVAYAAVDSHLIKEWQARSTQMQDNNADLVENPPPASHSALRKLDRDDSTFTDGPTVDGPYSNAPDLSLSENLPTGTPEVVGLGKHIELRRGGYSRNGSFKHRLLSPSPLRAESTAVLDESQELEASYFATDLPLRLQARNVDESNPVSPETPSPSKSRPSGSPLKLFGPHDTFTNDRLLRRISQLEPGVQQADERRSAMACMEASSRRQGGSSSVHNSFGSGELDDHVFNAGITITSASGDSEETNHTSPILEISLLGGIDRAHLKVTTPPGTCAAGNKQRPYTHRASCSKGSTSKTIQQQTLQHATVEDATDVDVGRPTNEADRNIPAEGKRPPPSPFRSPTPKRRRTLHASELASEQSTRRQPSASRSFATTTNEPAAENVDLQTEADCGTIAQRGPLRPRNPTPSQRRPSDLDADIEQAVEKFAARRPDKVKAFIDRFDASVHSDDSDYLHEHLREVATEVAEFTLRVSKDSDEHTVRMPSFTTQDFTAEAIKVMNALRAKNWQNPMLTSVNEDDMSPSDVGVLPEQEALIADPELVVTSLVQGDRPTTSSRLETNSNPLARNTSGLRRFQETEDTLYMPESEASLEIDKVRENAPVSEIHDECSKIHIIVPSGERQPNCDDLDGTHPFSPEPQPSPQQFNAPSTGKTTYTESTRRTDNLGTLAPDAVGHLIGDDCGVMSFDKERNCWVRAKRTSTNEKGFLEPPSQLSASDDDPLREISDLPVDEQLERRRISSPDKAVSRPTMENTDEPSSARPAQMMHDRVSMIGRTTSEDTVIARPVTRDGVTALSGLDRAHSSSVPSKHTYFGSSRQNDMETRATSWATEELRVLDSEKARKDDSAPDSFQSAAPSGDDYALSEVLNSSAGGSNLRPPIPSFPSPIELRSSKDSRDLPGDHETQCGSPLDVGTKDMVVDERSDLLLEESTIESLPTPRQRNTPLTSKLLDAWTHRSGARSYAARKQTIPFNLQHEMHEASELSFIAPVAGQRLMSVSVSVSKPLVARLPDRGLIAHMPSSPLKDPNGTFLLSDLPDFTEQGEEEERPSEKQLMSRLTQHATAQIGDRYALSRSRIVQAITDEHENEPYWEDLTKLDLHSRSLTALIGLDEFCMAVDNLNVSDNLLTDLAGVPVAVRSLMAKNNQLDNLTDWSRLLDLHFLDVSGNRIETLDAFECLLHLRELRIDDNKVASIDGIFGLDALLSLSVRGNQVREVDFSSCQLQSLTQFDLSNNQIVRLECLDRLSSLASLTLDGNDLANGFHVERTMTSLQELSLKYCGLRSLDVTNFPALRKLNVDGNNLTNIQGLSTLRHLDVLSMRRQSLGGSITITLFDEMFDARTIKLSHNHISTLRLNQYFLRTEHLEMAAVGLQELPADFAMKFANLRTLNLNFNFVHDIKPLLGLQVLHHVSLCGNKLERLRKTASVLAKMPSLRSLDLRDNLVTHGFYAPQIPVQSSILEIERAKLGTIAGNKKNHEQSEDMADLQLLPRADAEDQSHQARLDEETKLRRRVYELLFANSCASLEFLDGAMFIKETALAKDWIWKRLVKLGIVRKLDGADS